MKNDIPVQTKFARRKTKIFEKIEKAAQDLHDSILEISDLQDEFALSETSIEHVDEWSSDAIHSLNELDHRITDLDCALLDNTTVVLFDEDED